MASLFRHRDFVLLWSGQAVSELGSAVTVVAFPLVAVVILHASAFEVSLLTAATSIGWLMVGLPAGVWIDRLPRRPVLIGTDLGRAALMASVPLAWSLHVLSVGHLIAVALARVSWLAESTLMSLLVGAGVRGGLVYDLSPWCPSM